MPGCSSHLDFPTPPGTRDEVGASPPFRRRAGVGMTKCAAEGWQFYFPVNTNWKLEAVRYVFSILIQRNSTQRFEKNISINPGRLESLV